MTPPKSDAVALLRELVRIDSRNPSLAPGAPGEAAVARRLVDAFQAWGIDAKLMDAIGGRPNVVATIKGSGGGKSLMFNGHIDTVDVIGMIHSPLAANEKDGRMYGRGTSDMKGGVAAMCVAASRLQGKLKGDLVVACVADEEWRSAGTASLLKTGIRTDAAIVTEPTRLKLMPAHKGFVWLGVTALGTAAHGSRWDLGVDAIRNAAAVLVELDRVDREELPRRTHPLLGRASLHAGEIKGGNGISTYPSDCTFSVERRTLPGETVADVEHELTTAVAKTVGRFECSTLFSQPPSDVALDAPIVVALSKTLREFGISDEPAGMSAWTDAALLNAAGIPAICFGPGDMGLAHAAEEYIESREVEQAADVLESFAMAWCN